VEDPARLVTCSEGICGRTIGKASVNPLTQQKLKKDIKKSPETG